MPHLDKSSSSLLFEKPKFSNDLVSLVKMKDIRGVPPPPKTHPRRDGDAQEARRRSRATTLWADLADPAARGIRRGGVTAGNP